MKQRFKVEKLLSDDPMFDDSEGDTGFWKVVVPGEIQYEGWYLTSDEGVYWTYNAFEDVKEARKSFRKHLKEIEK